MGEGSRWDAGLAGCPGPLCRAEPGLTTREGEQQPQPPAPSPAAAREDFCPSCLLLLGKNNIDKLLDSTERS